METRLKRFLSLALALLMVFSMMPQITLGASAANLTGGTKLYLTPNDNWKKDNARFAIYVFGSAGNAWVSMTKVTGETDLYEVTVPNGNWTNVIFCRMNPSTTANNWNNKWNQTADLTWDGSKNHYTVKAGTWDKGGGTWSTYGSEEVEPETSEPEVTETVYYIRGDFNSWGTTNPMTKNADGTYSVTISLAAGTYEYKAAVEDWSWGLPSDSSNMTLTLAEAADVTFKLDLTANTLTNNAPVSDVEPTPYKPEYLIAVGNGDGNWLNGVNWDPADPTNKMTEVSDNVYEITYTDIEAFNNYQFKIAANGSWAVNWGADGAYNAANNYKLTVDEDGSTVTIRADLSETYASNKPIKLTVTVEAPAVEPECEHTSHDQDGKCTECGEPVEHTAGAAATCCTAQTCTVCGKELAPATGEHTYEDGCTATRPDDGINTLEELIAALAGDATEIVITETIVIPEGETITIDLNGKTVTHVDAANKYAINNLGTLTLKDSKGNGSISARGIYNGYNAEGNHVATAKITVESGIYNAKGTNGGAAIFNYGVVEIYGGTFTSVGSYSLNNQSGATMVIGDGIATADASSTGIVVSGGIYNTGATLTVNEGSISNSRSGAHTIYAWNSDVTINGGTIHNDNSGNSTIMAAGTSEVAIQNATVTINIVDASSSYLLDAQNTASYTITGGNFTGGVRAQSGTSYTISGGNFTNEYGNYNVYDGGTVSVSGGTFSSDYAQAFATNNLTEGYELKEDGTVAEKPHVPAGTITYAFTDATSFWGEGKSNSKESFVVELYEGDKKIASATLKAFGDVQFDGDVYATWSIPFDGTDSNYWTVEWAEGYPNINMAPTAVKLIADGKEVATNNVQWNGPDNVNKIVALAADKDGNFLGAYTKLADAMNSNEGGTVNVLCDVTEDLAAIKNVTLTGNDVTVTNTNTGWINMTNVTVASGVTLAVNKAYYTDAGVNVIEGTLSVATLYNANNSKTTVQNGGKIVTTGMIVNRYHTDAEAGIYVYGDGDASTVEVSCADTIGTYSGTFYAKDAVVEGKMLWIDYKKNNDEEADKYTQSKPQFENSVLNIASELRFYKDATLTLTNSSVTAGKVQIRQDATPVVNIDSASSIKATTVENLSGASLNAVLGEDGTVTFKRILLGTGTEVDPILITCLEDLILFRDTVNTYTQDGSNQFKGKYVKLTADIDLAGINWTPIGDNAKNDHEAFLGIFDGDGHTISNLYINSNGDHLGLFARVGSYAEGITPTVKNLKFHNVDVSSNTLNGHNGSYVGGVIANAGGNSVVSNITVTGDVKVVGYGYVGGIVGHGYPDLTNCHVKANDGSYLKCYYWCAGGIIGYAGERGTPIVNCSVSSLDIWSAYGAAAAVAGLLQDGNKVENVSASNVEITSNSDYCMGYIAGNGECSTLTNVKIENVTATANGKPITATDAVASIGETPYFSLQDAAEAAQSGETIVLIADVTLTETVSLPDGVIFNGNGKTIDGTIHAAGNLTFAGETKVTSFNPGYYNHVITIGEGASLEITGTGRMTWGWGNTFNITGTIENAKTADKSAVKASLIVPAGVSITGSGFTLNATNAYISLGSTTSKPGEATNTFSLNLTNSIADFSKNLCLYASTGSATPTFTTTIKDSVLNVATNLVLDHASCDTTIDNSVVNVGSAMRNSGELNIVNGSNVTVDAMIQYSSGNAGNAGTINVDASKLNIACSTEGHAIDGNGTGKLNLTNGATANITYIKNHAEIVLDNTSSLTVNKLTVDGVLESSGDITGTIVAGENAEISIYAGTYTQDVKEWCALGYTTKDNDDGTWTVKSAVEAKIGKKSYATLAEAVAAAKEGDTILLQADVIVDEVLVINHNITIADYGTFSITCIGDGAFRITGSNNLNLDKVIVTAPVYADSNTAGATIGNAVAITGTSEHKSTVTSDGETVTVTNPKWVADVNGTVYYLTIDEAIKGAVADDTVNIYAGEYNQSISVNKAITVVGETDAEGNNLVNFTGKLNITADGAAVKNINFNNGGSTAGYISAKDVLVEGCSVVGGNGFRYCYTSGTVTFKDSTITGSTYGIHFDGSARGNIVIDNCVITGWTSFAGTIEKVSMKDTTFDEGSQNYIRFYQNADLENCTFNDKMKVDISVSGATVNVTKPTFNGEIENLFYASDIDASNIIVDGTRLITPEASINGVEYDTFAEAIAAIGDGDVVIELITDVTLDYNAREAYGTDATTSVTINGNGKTVTLNQKDSDWSSIGLKNNAKLVLNNMTVEKTGYGDTSGAWNTHAIQFTCPVKMTDVVINNAIAVEAGTTLNNVTINEANGYYGLWIVGNGQTVTVNGGAINATNGGRGIKIADEYVDSAKQVTLNVTGTKFTTAKKAAVLVSSTAGAKITANGADISGVAEDTVNFAWVDEDWAATSSTVTVNGEPAALESAEEFIVTATSNGVLGHYKTLEAAAAAADEGTEVTILTAGTYKVPTGKNLTITGAVDGVVFDNIGACGMGGASVTFNNVTFDYLPNTNYTGLQHSGNMVYNNCTINGQVFLYGTSETFNNCTFNQTSADAYNVWTYGAKEVAFNECTFNSAGKSVLIYSEQKDLVNDVTVTDCDFIASAPVDGKAAIEMDSSLTSGINLTIDGETTATGFGTGNVSGNSLWNNKKDNKVEANNDITVIVNNETVLEPLTLVAQVGSVKYINIEDAIAAVENAGTIELLTDVEISETLYVNSNSAFDKSTITINGNGHTIKAVGEGWTNKMHMVDIAWNVTLNNVTFDGNNTGCRGVQFYTSSSTLNNVTVKNISADLWSWTDYAIHANASDLTVTGTLTFENCKYGNLHLDIGSNLPEGTVSVVDTASATLKGAKIVLEGANTSATAKRLHVRYAAAELNGTYYGVLADAIALAQVDDQLVLMADAEKIELTKSINLDVNGKTVGEFVLTAADVILTAEEGLNVTTAVEDHKVVYANGVYSVERKPNADITYGIYDVETTGEAGTESYRERMAVDLYNVYAKESLVIELYSGETKLSTTTLRESDRDDATVKFYPYSGDITANIVIAGRLAGSWNTKWHVAPSVYSLPDSIKVYADGELVATWNGGFMNEEEAENFGQLPTVEKPFKLAGANVMLGDSLKMYFYVNYADLVGEDYYAEIRRTFADGTADEVIKVPYSKWEHYNSKMIRVSYNGLSAKAMTDELYVTIYNVDGTVASQTWEDSIKAYAMRQLSTTSSAKLKTVLVDLLNYGAAAQAEFGNYGINDLANADLTAEQKAYATQTVTPVDNREKGINYAGSSISLKSSIVLTMYFQNLTSELMADPTVDDMYAIVTYTDHYGKKEELRVEGEDFFARDSMHGVDITGLAVADGKQLVTCVIYDADDNEIAHAADSIESYIARMANTADPIYEMVMKFVTSAIAYFGNTH